MSGSNANRRAGIATLTIDGAAYDVAGEAEYMASPIDRTSLKGQSGVQGFSEMPQVPFISATIRDNGSLSTAALNALTSSTLVLNQANGKTVYGDGMWQVGEIEVNTQEGTFGLRFRRLQRHRADHLMENAMGEAKNILLDTPVEFKAGKYAELKLREFTVGEWDVAEAQGSPTPVFAKLISLVSAWPEEAVNELSWTQFDEATAFLGNPQPHIQGSALLNRLGCSDRIQRENLRDARAA